MKNKKLAALCGVLFALCLPLTVWGGEELTKGEILDILLRTAPEYTSYISAEDIVSGYNEGDFREDKLADDIEMLVMLSRAFPSMEEPHGINLITLPEKADIGELPYWAQKHFDYLDERGIITSDTVLDDSVTRGELDTYLKRVWHYYGTDPRDDFYAYANRDKLSELYAGEINSSSFLELNNKNTDRLREIIDNIGKNNAVPPGERRIKAIYDSSLRMLEGRGDMLPVKSYISRIDSAKNDKELMKTLMSADKDIQSALLFRFDLTVDIKNSSACLPCFEVYKPTFDYADFVDDRYKDAFVAYVKKILVLSGEASETAELEAERLYNFEKGLSYHCLTESDAKDPEKSFNKIKVSELQEMFDNVDIAAFAKAEGLTLNADDDIVVFDRGLIFNFAAACREDTGLMKIVAKVALADRYGSLLSKDCIAAADDFTSAIYKTRVKRYTDKERAVEITKSYTASDLGLLYCDKYFAPEDKKAVTEITDMIISAYKQRISSADWMSDTTKAKAVKKLDSIDVKVGGGFDNDVYKNADIRSENSLYKNRIAMIKAERAYNSRQQNRPIDKNDWIMPAYIPNASYVPSQNAIILPAGILETPFYSADASFEENMGGIGMIIGHEICHALDDTGALYDEKGNYNNWWSAEDYMEFSQKCSDIADFYDKQETAPGVEINGLHTVGENIADLGAAACVTDAVKKAGGDLETFYLYYASVWRTAYAREMVEYQGRYDDHADARLRVNLSLSNVGDFLETFDVEEGNGMYVPEDKRVGLW
ncbi:MAG: M13 family metallopeptidase [Firmicutes bacterium]|nr:M13 family metallopeptidase [Bacillota bacterium]